MGGVLEILFEKYNIVSLIFFFHTPCSQLELLVPNLVSKNEGSVIVRSSTELFYIGQILDISTTVLR